MWGITHQTIRSWSFLTLLSSVVVLSGCWLLPNSNVSENVNTFPETCGGIAGITCPTGYECVYSDPTMPDGAGLCLPISAAEPTTLTTCGGQAQATCPAGYTCQLPANAPASAEGVCLPDY